MSWATSKKRSVEVTVPREWLGRMSERMTPMAGTAREVAAQRIENARLWAAPKLDQAAQSVEEQIAPIVSAFLSDLARRIEVSAARKARRRWPFFALCAGVAIGAIGMAMYRGNARRRVEAMRQGGRPTVPQTGRTTGLD